METIPCAICGIDDAQRLLIKNSFQLVRCRRCGLVYVNPRPTAEELDALYTGRGDELEPEVSDTAEWHRRKFARRFRLIEALFPRPGYVLDVGCSAGYFLYLAHQAGWQAFGIDVSAKAVAYACSRFRVEARVDRLETADFPDRTFDVITLFDSIEHMPAPGLALQQAHRLLKDDGLLVITTPNVDGLFPRLTYWLFGRTIGAWEHCTPPGHVFQFSRKTLTELLAKAGFRVTRYVSEEIRPDYTVGKLENAILDALKRSDGRKPNGEKEKLQSGTRKSSRSAGGPSLVGRLKGLPRRAVRMGSWALVGVVYPMARLLGKGDSMLVIAGKDTAATALQDQRSHLLPQEGALEKAGTT